MRRIKITIYISGFFSKFISFSSGYRYDMMSSIEYASLRIRLARSQT